MARSGRRRSFKIYLVGTAIGLGIFAAASWLALPTIVERGLMDRMRSSGIPVSNLRVTAVDLGKAEIEDLRIGENDELSAGRIVAHFSLGGLFAGKVDGVELRDLRISARLDSDGLKISGLERSVGVRPRDSATAVEVPPITIDNGRIDLATELGGFVLPFSGTVMPAPGRSLHAAIKTGVESAFGKLTGRVDIAAAAESISADIQIDGGQIAVGRYLESTLVGQLRVDLTAAGEPTLQGDLQLGPTALAGLPFDSGSISIDGSLRQWAAHLTLLERDRTSKLAAQLAVSGTAGSPHAAAALRLSAAASSMLWDLIGVSAPADGSALVDLDLAGRPPAGGWSAATVTAPDRLVGLLASGDLAGRLSLQAEALRHPSVGNLQSLAASFDLRAADGALTLGPSSEVQMTATPATEVIASLRLPADIAARFGSSVSARAALSTPLRVVTGPGELVASSGLSIALAGADGAEAAIQGSGTLRLSPTLEVMDFSITDGSAHIRGIALPGAIAKDLVGDGEVTGSVGRMDGRMRLRGTLAALQLGDLGAQEAQLDLNTEFRMKDGRVDLRAPAGGTVILRQVSSPNLAATLKEMSLPFSGMAEPLLSARFGPDGPVEVSHAIQLDGVKVNLPLLLGGAKPTRATLRSGVARVTGTWTRETGYRAAFSFPDAVLSLPGQQVSAQALQAELERPATNGGRSLTFSITRIQSTQTPAAFVPVAFSGKAEFTDDRVVMKGKLTDARKAIDIAVDLVHAVAARKGQAAVKMRPIVFHPDKLQPQDLLPAAAARIAAAEGSAAIAGRLSWTRGKIRSELKLLLQDITLALPQVEIVRLNSVVAIKSLVPFATEPGQPMAIGLLDIGVPLTDALASFRFEPGPKLVIEAARLSLAGGQVSVDPLEFDPRDPHTDTTLHVLDLRLDRLLQIAAIDGLSATGRLAGQIPLVIRGNTLAIRDAVLNATEPGILRYAPKATPSALSGAGESVTLALQALSNFQYSELQLTLNRDAGGETVALMHVKGRNPDFYGGYPVEFNLNVSGKLDQIVDRSLSSYRVPDTIRERLQQFSR